MSSDPRVLYERNPGWHHQLPLKGEVRLVHVTCRSVFDVVIDRRKGYAADLKHFGIESNANIRMALQKQEMFTREYPTITNQRE